MAKYRFLIALIGMSLLFAACSPGAKPAVTPAPLPIVKADTAIMAEGRLEPVSYAEIAFSTSGVVHEVLVEAGDTVQRGEPLVRLGDETDTNYASAQLELVSAQQALNELMGSSGTDLAQLVIDLKDAQEACKRAENYLEYLRNSDKIPQTAARVILIQTWRGYEYGYKTKSFKGPAPQDWITEAENDLALKKAKLEQLQRAYERMKDGVDSNELAVLEAKLNAANAKVASFSILAPFDGVVAGLEAKVGGSITAGESAVTVADFSSWIVRTTDVTELDVVSLQEGQPVTVTLDALPGPQLTGQILHIGQTYSQNQGDIVYEVTILLGDTHPAMRWGMTAAVRFGSED